MKSTQACQHCGALDFFTFTVQAGGLPGSLLPVGLLHGPSYENIVCGQCGHVEWFVSKEHIPQVRAKFARITAPGSNDA